MPNGSLPDTGERTVRRWELTYKGNDGASIVLFTGKQGWRFRAAKLVFSNSTTTAQVSIPGDDSDHNSHFRQIEIDLPQSELFPIIDLLSYPGTKTLFGNEQSNTWWIKDRNGHQHP